MLPTKNEHHRDWRALAIGIGIGAAGATLLRQVGAFGFGKHHSGHSPFGDKSGHREDASYGHKDWVQPPTAQPVVPSPFAIDPDVSRPTSHTPSQTTQTSAVFPEDPEEAESHARRLDADRAALVSRNRGTEDASLRHDRETARNDQSVVVGSELSKLSQEDRIIVNENFDTAHRMERAGMSKDPNPFDDDAIQTLAYETLRENPHASYDDVLSAWKVRRGEPVDAEEESRVAAVYGRLHEAFDAA